MFGVIWGWVGVKMYLERCLSTRLYLERCGRTVLLEGDAKDVGNILDVGGRRHLQSSTEQEKGSLELVQK